LHKKNRRRGGTNFPISKLSSFFSSVDSFGRISGGRKVSFSLPKKGLFSAAGISFPRLVLLLLLLLLPRGEQEEEEERLGREEEE